jgi:hypothetical protein
MTLDLKCKCFLCTDLNERGGYIGVSPEFRLAADIAPLTSNHCLFYTSTHTLSFAHLTLELLQYARRELVSMAGLPMFAGERLFYFEHGPNLERTNVVGCCDHAHIHVLPIAVENQNLGFQTIRVSNEILNQDESDGKIEFIGTRSIDELGTLVDQNYFWVATDLLALNIFTIKVPERQYLRRVVARTIGMEHYKTWEMYDEDAATSITRSLRLTTSGKHRKSRSEA